MNILFLMHRFIGFGGIEMVTKNLAIELNAKFSHTIKIFSIVQQDVNKETFLSPNYDVYVAHSNSKKGILVEFKEYLNRFDFDILVFQDSYARIEYLLKEAIKKDIPIITVEHNSPDCFIKSHKRITEKIKEEGASWFRLLIRSIRYRLLVNNEKKRRENLIKLSKRYILLSNRYKPTLKQYYGIESDRIQAITNPVKFKSNEFNSQKKNIALFVGRLTVDKGVDMLMEVWSKLEHRLPDWKLVIVGEGPEREHIVKEIIDRNLQRIELHGFTDNIGYYYKDASVLLMTSRFEGLALIIAEAMAFGVVPFIFNSFESLYDIVENGKDGYIINAFDTNEFANSIERFVNLPEDDKTTMRNNAVIKSKKFSLEAIVIEWNNLFNKILNKQ